MHIHYWFGTSMKNLLFQGYSITSMSGLVATCFGIASLAVLLEAMRVLHALLKVDSEQSEEDEAIARRWCLPSTKLKQLSVETTCYIFEGIIGYLVMLCVMTYNGYFTIAVSCGAALGYFVFGPRLLEIRLNARNIHWKRNASISGAGELLGPSGSVPSTPPTISSIHSRDSSLSEVAEGLVAAVHHAQKAVVDVEVIRSMDQDIALPSATIATSSSQAHSE